MFDYLISIRNSHTVNTTRRDVSRLYWYWSVLWKLVYKQHLARRHTHTHKLRKNAGNQLDCQTGNHKAASLIAKLCGQFNSDLRSPLLSLSTFYLLKFLRRMLNKHFSVGNLIGEDMNTDPKTVTRFSTAVPRG